MEHILRNNILQFIDDVDILRQYSLLCKDEKFKKKRQDIMKMRSNKMLCDRLNENKEDILIVNNYLDPDFCTKSGYYFLMTAIIEILFEGTNLQLKFNKNTIYEKYVTTSNIRKMKFDNIQNENDFSNDQRIVYRNISPVYRMQSISVIRLKKFPYAKALIY